MIDIHLLVTTLCDRDCKYCCNKQYDVQNLQYVTDEELKDCRYLFLTGGEPFIYANPSELAGYYKAEYPNIEKVIVYTNAKELVWYLRQQPSEFFYNLDNIDGLNISIKSNGDLIAYEILLENPYICSLVDNRIYDFTGRIKDSSIGKIIHRKWQKNFVPAEGSIFRRGN